MAYDKEWEICTVEPCDSERLDSELLLDSEPLPDDQFAYLFHKSTAIVNNFELTQSVHYYKVQLYFFMVSLIMVAAR